MLLASITYFKAEVGDSVSIVLPAEGEVNWAAIENVLTGTKDEIEAQINTLKIQEDKERIKKEAKEKSSKTKKPESKPGEENYTIDEL